MQVYIQKWGNSLALRIPRSYAKEVNVRQGASLDLSVRNGKLILTPLVKSSFSLKKLLAMVHPSNDHQEQDFGSQRGKEIW